MSRLELETRFGSVLYISGAVAGVVWVFRERGFYPANLKGDYIET